MPERRFPPALSLPIARSDSRDSTGASRHLSLPPSGVGLETNPRASASHRRALRQSRSRWTTQKFARRRSCPRRDEAQRR
jgi:hypothetical protein